METLSNFFQFLVAIIALIGLVGVVVWGVEVLRSLLFPTRIERIVRKQNIYETRRIK